MYKIQRKTQNSAFFFFYLIEILHTNPSSHSFPSSCFHHLLPEANLHLLSERVRIPMKSPQSLGRSKPSPLYLGWARYPSKENGFQNANSSSKDKSWPHCQWLLRLPQPYNCHLHSEGLVWSYSGSYAVRLESELPLAQVSYFCGYLNQFLNWGVGRLQSKPRESFRPREWWLAVLFPVVVVGN